VVITNPDALDGPITPLRTTWVLNVDWPGGIGVPVGTAMGIGSGWTAGGTVEPGAGPLLPAGRCPPDCPAALDDPGLLGICPVVAAPVEDRPVAFEGDVAGDVAVPEAPEAAGADEALAAPGSVAEAVSVGEEVVPADGELALRWTPEGDRTKITMPKTASTTTATPRAQRVLDDSNQRLIPPSMAPHPSM
jgi:hypothetical protein